MKRVLKIVMWVVLALIVVLAAAVFAGLQMGERKLKRQIDANPQPVAYATSAEVLPQGKYLFDSRGCAECHGANGEGRVMIDKDGFHVRTPNISPTGVVARYTERDWVRAIRHGVKPDNTPLFIMPSEDYNRLTDADFAALVAYSRSLPPSTGPGAEIRLPVPVKVLYGFGAIPDAAEKIDHKLPPAQPVQVAANAAHGAYVANMCIGCHGPTLSGGNIPGGPPEWPAAANITPGAGSIMPIYDTAEKFRAMMRNGKRPDGSTVNAAMPFSSLKAMNDTDLDALYAFLKTVPAKAAGGR
ncbi:MAG: c-type cytochrome [Betaproteobacteria bacterium]|nr:c-type cytochrome [Betaproteobacteria bacterium]